MRSRVLRAVAVVLVPCATAAALGACSRPAPKPLRTLTFTVDHPTESDYAPVGVKLSGLKPGEHVAITSSASDYRGARWQGRGTYAADASGVVDLAKQPSTAGTYTGVDAMGLLWSMDPPTGVETAGFFPDLQQPFTVTLRASGTASAAGAATLVRQVMAPGVTTRKFNLALNRVLGTLFVPAPVPDSTKPRPAVVLFGGSDGGETQDYTAAALASEGFPALSIAYFDAPGLPATLAGIPLEYFEQAATDLANTPGVDRDHVLMLGYSRGSEAALLSAQYFPQAIHGAIVYSPTAFVVASYPDGLTNAWSLQNRSISTGDTIPVDHIAGPVLAFAGSDDHLWRSAGSAATRIDVEVAAAHNRFPHKATVYPGAGHGVFDRVGFPEFIQVPGATTDLLDLGGTRQANAAAQYAAWSDVLSLLKSLAG